MYGHVRVLQQLLDAELQLKDCASVNRKDASGQAALYYAARWGYPEVGLCYMTENVAVMPTTADCTASSVHMWLVHMSF